MCLSAPNSRLCCSWLRRGRDGRSYWPTSHSFRTWRQGGYLVQPGPYLWSTDTVCHHYWSGGSKDGRLRQYGVFDENGLVAMPKNLNFEEAATLGCVALTAWNGLYGLQGRMVMPGDIILTQGTGSVSIFALQVSFRGLDPWLQRNC